MGEKPTNKNCHITYREHSAATESMRESVNLKVEGLKQWLITELRLRDKAADIARTELSHQLEHLNNLRQGVVMKETHDRERDTLNERLKIMEGFRNKAIGVALAISAISGVLGGVIGYIISHASG